MSKRTSANTVVIRAKRSVTTPTVETFVEPPPVVEESPEESPEEPPEEPPGESPGEEDHSPILQALESKGFTIGGTQRPTPRMSPPVVSATISLYLQDMFEMSMLLGLFPGVPIFAGLGNVVTIDPEILRRHLGDPNDVTLYGHILDEAGTETDHIFHFLSFRRILKIIEDWSRVYLRFCWVAVYDNQRRMIGTREDSSAWRTVGHHSIWSIYNS